MSSDVVNQPVDNSNIETPAGLRLQRRNRLMGTLVLAVILLPMVIAYIIFETGIGIPSGTVNKGELLLPPQAISQLPLYDDVGQPVDILAEDKKWRLLIPVRGDCDQACQQALYLTRQVHVRLGEKASRVERYYFCVDSSLTAKTQAYLAKEHPRLKVASVNESALSRFLAPTNAADDPIESGRYFLMDQEGFVMMSYTPEHKGNELLDDIKRLLKYSYEG